MRKNLWPKALLAAASLTVLAAAPAQYLGRQQDDLLYLISAEALSRGHYRLFTVTGAPPLTMITPGFPLLLLPVTLLFGENHAAHQAYAALALAALPWALWFWLRRRLDDETSALVAALAATSPIALSQSGAVMSEPFYALIMVALLLTLEKPASGWLYLLLTQVRPAGLSAAAALDWRRLWPAAVGALLWSAWSYSVSGEVQELQELRLSFQGQGWLFPLRVAFDNLLFYLSAWGNSYVPFGGLALGTLLAALAAKGARGPAGLMLAGAGLMHLVWAWQYERYLLPLLPWLLWGVAVALKRRAKPALAALLLAQTALHTWRWALKPSPFAEPELRAAYAWLREHSKPDEALASALPVRDGYWAVRPASPLPREDIARRLKSRGVRWVLWQKDLDVGLSAARAAAISVLLEQAEARLSGPEFRLAYEDAQARIYEVR